MGKAVEWEESKVDLICASDLGGSAVRGGGLMDRLHTLYRSPPLL